MIRKYLKLKIILLIQFFLFVLIFSSCMLWGDIETMREKASQGIDIEIHNIRWETDGNGFIQFSTNDPNYYNWSWWQFYENINNISTFDIELKKISGSNSGYGFVFGASNSNNNQFYYLSILIDGYYGIYKKNNDVWTTIKSYEKSDKLFTGYNVINNLKVIKNVATYTVSINGSEVLQFIDTEINGNRFGYLVEIGSENEESFPNTPVDVRFRQK